MTTGSEVLMAEIYSPADRWESGAAIYGRQDVKDAKRPGERRRSWRLGDRWTASPSQASGVAHRGGDEAAAEDAGLRFGGVEDAGLARGDAFFRRIVDH